MKMISLIIFDNFTDIDLFLMWDILGRNRQDWKVQILGTQNQHHSSHGLWVSTHGHIKQANQADIVLFSSGQKGVPAVIHDPKFLDAFSLNPHTQIIGSICAGALILASLGLLKKMPATTHPKAKSALEKLGVTTIDKPLVCQGNVATAGGCLSALYLVGWCLEKVWGIQKRIDMLDEVIPTGQKDIFEQLITASIQDSYWAGEECET